VANISRNLSEFYSKDREKRIQIAYGKSKVISTFSVGTEAAAGDQSFGCGSFIACNFHDATQASGCSMRYWIGRVIRILILPKNGVKRILHQRIYLNEIVEDMYIQCTWLQPVAWTPTLLDATRYRLCSAEENIAPVQAKYVISVVDVKEPEKDPTRKDVIFTVDARDIQQLKAYVMAAADSEEDVSRHPKRRKGQDSGLTTESSSTAPSASTSGQHAVDGGHPPVITTVTKSGRKASYSRGTDH
jgi:hypothetical protein